MTNEKKVDEHKIQTLSELKAKAEEAITNETELQILEKIEFSNKQKGGETH
ncbi:MAG: hypothetical protein HY072_07590 [Deltaproteobacteria bacterium]|nr:hypothetical protein [Deltaproteobacteria bacterium]